jgi:predicted DNA-binding transcriptional regulator AlpA
MSSYSLPETGYVRLPTILRVFPVSRSTWWQWVKDGKAPAGTKLGPRITAWRVEDIHALIAAHSK